RPSISPRRAACPPRPVSAAHTPPRTGELARAQWTGPGRRPRDRARAREPARARGAWNSARRGATPPDHYTMNCRYAHSTLMHLGRLACVTLGACGDSGAGATESADSTGPSTGAPGTSGEEPTTSTTGAPTTGDDTTVGPTTGPGGTESTGPGTTEG